MIEENHSAVLWVLQELLCPHQCWDQSLSNVWETSPVLSPFIFEFLVLGPSQCLISQVLLSLALWLNKRLRFISVRKRKKFPNKAHILPMCCFNWTQWKKCWDGSIRSRRLEQETNWSCKTSSSLTNQLIIYGLQWSRES